MLEALASGTPASLGQVKIVLIASPAARHTKDRKVDRYDHDVSRCCMNPLQFGPEAECLGTSKCPTRGLLELLRLSRARDRHTSMQSVAQNGSIDNAGAAPRNDHIPDLLAFEEVGPFADYCGDHCFGHRLASGGDDDLVRRCVDCK